jgi:hypothetical protein
MERQGVVDWLPIVPGVWPRVWEWLFPEGFHTSFDPSSMRKPFDLGPKRRVHRLKERCHKSRKFNSFVGWHVSKHSCPREKTGGRHQHKINSPRSMPKTSFYSKHTADISIIQVSFGFIYGRSWHADSGIDFCGQGHTCSTSFLYAIILFRQDWRLLCAVHRRHALKRIVWKLVRQNGNFTFVKVYDSGHSGMGVVGWILVRFQV